MTPYSKQSITEEDINEVLSCLKSAMITQGPKIPEFETKLSQRSQAQHAVAVNSGTAALHIACLALGLGEEDLLWTSPITFAASANCGRYCGATVDFVDIDPATGNMCPDALARKLEHAAETDSLPKIIIPVHYSGLSCDMEAIHKLCQAHGIKIIEDASHAVGASYQGKPVGSCEYSEVAVFSFHPVKMITTGEGGMALCNDPELHQRMQELRMHGITKASDKLQHKAEGAWYYEQQSLGYNFRLTDFQAALGISQLKRLDHFVARRQELAHQYQKLLASLPVVVTHEPQACESSWHIFPIRIDDQASKVKRAELFKYMQEHGMGVQVHYIPVHLQPYYRELGFKEGDFPKAEAFYKQVLSIPLFVEMTDEEQKGIVELLQNAFETLS